MANLQEIFNTEDTQNWFAACLATKCCREGLLDLIGTIGTCLQTQVIKNAITSNNLPQGTVCVSCPTSGVIPCFTKGVCKIVNKQCTFHKTPPRPCPNKLCDVMVKEIRDCHRYKGPSWRNTNADQWTSNPFEILKCFMPVEGYIDKQSAESTDFNGLINVAINCKLFENYFSSNLKREPNVCSEARAVTRDLRHNAGFKIDKVQLHRVYDALLALLSDPTFLLHDTKAQDAFKKISELKAGKLAVTAVDINAVLADMNNCRADIIEQMTEKVKEAVMGISHTTDEIVKKAVGKISHTIDEIVKEAEGKISEHADKCMTKNQEDLGGKVQIYIRNEVAAAGRDITHQSREVQTNIKDVRGILGKRGENPDAPLQVRVEVMLVDNSVDNLCSTLIDSFEKAARSDGPCSASHIGWITTTISTILRQELKDHALIKVRQECIALYFQSKSIEALLNLYEDSLSGRLTAMFHPIEDGLRKEPGQERLKLVFEVKLDDMWEGLKNIYEACKANTGEIVRELSAGAGTSKLEDEACKANTGEIVRELSAGAGTSKLEGKLVRIFNNEDTQNWFAACLATACCREVLLELIATVGQDLQTQVIEKAITTKHLSPGTVCVDCRTSVLGLIPCPTKGVCKKLHGQCLFHISASRPCPNNLCDAMAEEIRSCHRFACPSWQNTKANQWTSNPFEILKCFMPTEGYVDTQSAESTNFNGLINVVINCKLFEDYFTSDLKEEHDVCTEVRDVIRDLYNNRHFKLDKVQLYKVYDALLALLSDPKFMLQDQKAKDAFMKISELKASKLTVTILADKGDKVELESDQNMTEAEGQTSAHSVNRIQLTQKGNLAGFINNEDTHNCFAANLATACCRDGLLGLIGTVGECLQKQVIQNASKFNNLPPGTVCERCSTSEVIPCFTKGFCKKINTQCTFHKTPPRRCPNNLCDAMVKEIRECHRYKCPSWRNTNADQWASNPFEILKCFMPVKCYIDKESAETTDFNGLINVAINCKLFQNYFSSDLNKEPNVCTEARKVTTHLCHNVCFKLDGVQLDQVYDALLALLSDKEFLSQDPTAQDAVKAISELKASKLAVTAVPKA